MKIFILNIVLNLLSIAFTLHAQEKISLLPIDGDVLIDSLSNGLTYYIKENKEPQNRVYLYLVLKAGSLQETDEQLGLAHFTEHMAFNGTEHFPKNELINYLQKAGVRFGADLNAYTSFDQTVYKLPLPSDDEELLESGFEILSDWAGKMSLKDEDIENERGIIIEEERQRGKNVNERLSKQLMPVLLENSRYLKRIPIGKTEVIKNFEPNKLKDFYKAWYQPHLQAVMVVGDINSAAVESYIKQYFGTLKSNEPERYPESYTVPGHKDVKVKIATDPEYSYNVITVLYKHPAQPLINEDDFLKAVKRSAVNSMLAARIREIIQQGNAPFLSASLNYGPYQGGIGNLDAFTIQVVAKDASMIKDAVKAVMQEVDRAQQYGFTQTEWERVCENFRTSINNTYMEKDKIPSESFINQYISHFINHAPILNIEYTHSFYNKKLDDIDVDDLQEVFKNWVKDDNQIILLQASESDKNLIPDEEQLKNWVNGKRQGVSAYADDVVEGPFLDIELPEGKIKNRKKLNTIDATEITLDNGIKVIFKPTDFKNNQIVFAGFSPGGTSLADAKLVPAAKVADNIITGSGIANYSSTQVQKMLAGKTISLRPYISTYSEGISGSSNLKDIEQTLQLAYLYLTQPKFDSDVYNTYKENYRVSLKAQATNPISIFQDTITSVMQGKSPWVQSATLEELNQVQPEDALAFYNNRFDDAGDFTFVFVGNFELETLVPMVSKYLGALPDSGKRENFKDVGIRPLQGNIEKEIYKGLEDKSTVVLVYHNAFDYTDLNLKALQAIKTILENKLLERLREQEAGVYSPAIGLSISKIPQSHYSISINFSCASGRVEDLISATKEEINELIEEGVTIEDLNKFKAQEIRQHELNLRENSFWLNYIKNAYTYDTNLKKIKNFQKSLDALDTENLQQKLRTYLNTPNSALLVLYPESEKKEILQVNK